MLNRIATCLAQASPPWEDAPPVAPKAPVNGGGGIDLSKGFQQVYGGTVSENTFRNGMLVVVGVVIIVALVMHLRERRKQHKVVDSQFRLGWELCRLVPFPFGSRIMLWWVARSTRTPVATLLISARAFEQSINQWANQPTFALLRQWGRTRLMRLQPILFSEN